MLYLGCFINKFWILVLHLHSLHFHETPSVTKCKENSGNKKYLVQYTNSQNIFCFIESQLFSLTLVLFALLWIYAIISFTFLYSFFDVNQNLFCDSLFECYITVLRVGLFSSFGGVSILLLSIHDVINFY